MSDGLLAVPFSNIVYIEQSDFRMKDSIDYYGLASGKSVLLRYAFPIKCTKVKYSDDGKTVVEIHAEYDPDKKTKPKGVLHWVAQPSPEVDPLKAEVRLFENLFRYETILCLIKIQHPKNSSSTGLLHYKTIMVEPRSRDESKVVSRASWYKSYELNSILLYFSAFLER